MLSFIRMPIKCVLTFSYEPLTHINPIDITNASFLSFWDNSHLACCNAALDTVFRNVVFYVHRKTST